MRQQPNKWIYYGGTRSIRIFVGIVVAMFTGIFVSGCGSVRGYTGGSLPREQIAVLKLVDWGLRPGSVEMTSLDGRRLWCATQIELLPGRHTIAFRPSEIGFSGDSIIKEVVVEAGKTYKARMRIHYQEHNSSIEGNAISTKGSGEWIVVITESR